MPPVSLKDEINELIKSHRVLIFSKSWCGYCRKVKDLFNSLSVEHKVVELDQLENEDNMATALFEISGQKTVPIVYINGKHLGGSKETFKAHAENRLFAMINDVPSEYEYDLIVIGGGSGGLAASKQAADLGKKVLLCDFVKPTPVGTTWGLGGTCVNVGCIPKKLMHQGSLLGKSLEDSKKFGWQQPEEPAKHDWGAMVQNVQDYIGSLNWNYRVALRTKKVKYLNAYAEFVDAHTIKATNKRGVETIVTGDKILIAVGERPKYLDIPNAKECSVTSDDLFSLPYSPGKTLVVGASYVALECACFLKGLGYDVTIMVRSIFLRGFDQDIAERIGSYIKDVDGIKIHRRFVPIEIEKISDGQPGTYKVTGKSTESDETVTDEYNTILFAIGRESCTKTIGLDNVGVTTYKNGKIPVNDFEQTNVPNIYCIGDNAAGRPELTPVAILSGELLAKRLYANSKLKINYDFVATTVFTSLEYSCSGLSEEDAIEKFGDDNVDVYHSNFWPLEWTVAGRSNTVCYCKVIVDRSDNERILGMHYLGPNAGEVMQGYSAALNLGMTKEQLDLTVGIHPTTAEVLTSLHVTKRSGEDFATSGC